MRFISHFLAKRLAAIATIATSFVGCALTPSQLTDDVNFNSQAVFDHVCETCPSLLGSASPAECAVTYADQSYLPPSSPCLEDAYELDREGSLTRLRCLNDTFEEMHHCVETTLDCNDGGASYDACNSAHQTTLAACPPFPDTVATAMAACPTG